jgi:hypothetical protein
LEQVDQQMQLSLFLAALEGQAAKEARGALPENVAAAEAAAAASKNKEI